MKERGGKTLSWRPGQHLYKNHSNEIVIKF